MTRFVVGDGPLFANGVERNKLCFCGSFGLGFSLFFVLEVIWVLVQFELDCDSKSSFL